MKLRLLILTIFAALCSTVSADEEFDAANRAYEEGKFVEARQRYEALIEQGERTANITSISAMRMRVSARTGWRFSTLSERLPWSRPTAKQKQT